MTTPRPRKARGQTYEEFRDIMKIKAQRDELESNYAALKADNGRLFQKFCGLLVVLKDIAKQCRDSNEPTAISVRLQCSEAIAKAEGAK